MRKAVVTVEALRCHECQVLIDPVEGAFVRQRMRTAVEVGHRDGPIERYELANLCSACDEKLTAKWLAELEAGGQSIQSLFLLVLAFIVGVIINMLGWPSAVAFL